jgi:aspartate aminotransferase
LAKSSAIAEKMPRSGIREIRDLAARDPRVISLEIGEPNFPTAPHVVEAAHAAAAAGFTHYTSNAGIPELRELLADKLRIVNGLVVNASQIVVSQGAAQGLFATFRALLEPGDEILLPDPGWPNYAMIAHLQNIRQIYYPLTTENGYVPSAASLERLVTPRTKVIVINSPSNPVGSVIGRKQLAEVLAFATAHDLWVISDEVYDEINFTDDFVSAGAVGAQDRVIGVYSFSKTYAMTGWRVGYVAVPESLAEVTAKMQEPLISCISSVSQQAAVAALTGPQGYVSEMVAAYRSRRDDICGIFANAGIDFFRPAGAFYVWLNISASGQSSREFALQLLRDKQVAVAPGSAFGAIGDDHIRISLAAEPSALHEGCQRIASYLAPFYDVALSG